MKVTDPICGMKIDSDKAAAKQTVEGQDYFFCSAECHGKFLANRDRYAKKDESHECCCSHRH